MKSIVIILILSSCSAPFWDQPTEFSLLCLNTQTFFDDKISGSEFSDFMDPDSWNSELYKKRLHILGLYLSQLNYPDIVLLQEIENNAVLEDLISKELGSDIYPYYGCAGGDSVFRVAFLSKVPLAGLNSHQPPAAHGFSPRMFLEVVFGFKDFQLRVFNVHLKSKLQGAVLTADQRALEMEHIMDRVLASDDALVLAGDFNENWVDTNSKVLGNAIEYFGENQFWNHTASLGSYIYKNKWEKIDSICWRNLSVLECSTIELEGLSVRNGIPYKWNGKDGCSDHLGLYMRYRRN